MNSTRLTKSLRNDILSSLVAHSFDERKVALYARRAVLAEKIYQTLYTKKEHELLASLPEGFFGLENNISGQMCGRYAQLRFNGTTPGEYNRGPEVNKRCGNRMRGFILVGSDKFGIEYSKIEADASLLAEEIAKAKSAAEATLNRFTTTELLIKAWPEVAPLIPAMSKPARLLPVVQVESLNAMFDLPVDELVV